MISTELCWSQNEHKHNNYTHMKLEVITRYALTISLCSGVIMSTSCSSESGTDAAMTQAQGAVLGGLALGGSAFGIAKLSGADTSDSLLIAGAAAVLGGVLGNEWGKSIVKKKAAYASEEAYVQANIKQLDRRLDEARDMEAALNKKLSSSQKQITMTSDQLKAYKEASKQKFAMLDQDISVAGSAKQYATGSQVAQLEEKIKELKSIRSRLQASNRRLISQIRVA